MSHILVTGATGFVGRHLCAHLKKQGHTIRIISRQSVEGDWDECVVCDFKTASIPDNLCENIEIIYHLAGIAHAMSMPKADEWIYWRVNVEGTEALLKNASAQNVEKFIYFSSVKAMGDPGEDCVDETYQRLPKDPYGQSKREAEKRVLQWGQEGNRHAVCLRPTLVYGPGAKGNLLRMMSAIDSGRFPAIPDVENQRSMVSINDLISAAIMVEKKTNARNQVYIVEDGYPYSTRNLFDAMQLALEKPSSKHNLPLWTLKMGAKMGDAFGNLLDKTMPLNSEILERLLGSACYRADKLRHELDWQPNETFYEVVTDMVNVYREQQLIADKM